MSDKKEIEVPTEHPMEDVLDIEPGTTLVTKTVVSTDIVEHQAYDAKDGELDGQFQDIYDQALGAFEDQQEESELVEPKYKARNAEVAAQFLNTALSAANSKLALKGLKDKLDVSKARLGTGGGGTTNNNLIFTDRNSLLKLLEGQDEAETGEVIDGEFDDET